MRKKLPVGIENFEEFSKENFYYVDKTMFITELLQNWGKVNLFTRPRRFGKTLNMSMLKCFFEIGTDKSLFDGLKIAENRELCAEYQGQFPVIFISLKSVDGLTFASAAAALRTVIGREASRFQFLRDSDKLSKEDRESYEALIHVDKGLYDMKDELLAGSLKNLSQLLAKHYGRQVVLLIDEYDVPLDKAFQAGYYDEMVSLIRSLFDNAAFTQGSWYQDSIIRQVICPLADKLGYTAVGLDLPVVRYRQNPKGITKPSRSRNKSLDSLYITMQLFEDRKKYGLEITGDYYDYILSMAVQTYSRTRQQSDEVQRAIFTVYADFLDKNFREWKTENKKLACLEKALRDGDYGRYLAYCRLH